MIEYEKVRCAIERFNRVFVARHGREPRSMREISQEHREAWERRTALRKEFPGRPWANAQPMLQDVDASAGPSASDIAPLRSGPPTAVSNLSMCF